MHYRYVTAFMIILMPLTAALCLTESDKIQELLTAIERSGLIFIRNGTEHSSAEAKAHLSMKLSKAGSRIKTARDFITYIATKSSWTGKFYYVKQKDGKIMKAADWLYQRLLEIEKKSRNS